MKRAAIIGLGEVAPNHLAALEALKDVEIVAVCDSNPAKADRVKNIPFYTDSRALLKAEKPDVVHLCLPHFLHYRMARQAAEAGVNVFCEKPLANDLAEALFFAELEDEYPQLRFGLCLQNRYNSSTQALMKVIESGTEGAITGMKAIVAWHRTSDYYVAAPWRGLLSQSGGGVLNNQAVHTLDLMQLFGGAAESIRGSVSSLLDYGIEVEDTASAAILFQNGAQGLFFATVANSRNDSVELTVTLEHGEYRIADNALFRLTQSGGWETVCQDGRPEGVRFYYGSGHTEAIRDFYRCLSSEQDGYIHVREGVESMRMIDSIRRSSATGQTIRLSAQQEGEMVR